MRILMPIALAAIAAACGGTDGSPLLGDGGGSDTGNQTDGNPNKDGEGIDVTTDTGPSCPSFCGTVKGSFFCSDFDTESMPADWSGVSATNGGTVDVEQSQTRSCPNALGVSMPKVTSGGPVSARVTKNIVTGSTIGHLLLHVSAFLPGNDMTSFVSYFGMRPTSEATTGAYLTHHGDPYWFLSNGNFTTNIGITPPPMTNAWNDMTLDVEFGNPGKVTLTYTGTDNAQHMTTGPGVTANNAPGGVTVDVGMWTNGMTEAAFSAFYDNVVVQPAQ
jgi:hypothetical protein